MSQKSADNLRVTEPILNEPSAPPPSPEECVDAAIQSQRSRNRLVPGTKLKN